MGNQNEKNHIEMNGFYWNLNLYPFLRFKISEEDIMSKSNKKQNQFKKNIKED